jgi:hypothetical protein
MTFSNFDEYQEYRRLGAMAARRIFDRCVRVLAEMAHGSGREEGWQPADRLPDLENDPRHHNQLKIDGLR